MLPSFAELEARGAVIGEIRVITDNIFDRNDPQENNVLFRAANALHVRTQPWLIERVLLFKSGQPVSQRVIDETERLIRQTTTVYEVSIRPVALRDNVVDIEVHTRDTWTLQPGLRFRREGGATSAALNIKESNLLGTGTTIGLERNTSVDRTGTLAQISHDHLFDGWTSLALQRSTFDDGSAGNVTLAHPFYALDTRWAAGAQASRFDRRDSVFEGGNAVGDYRHFNHSGEVFAGRSNGLQGRWTHRQSVGVNYQSDRYEIDPSRPPPIAPPVDKTLAGPFLRYEAIEDDFLPVMNRDLIQRPEYLTMGLHSTLQLGRSLAGFGATEQPWQLSAQLTKGFRAPGGRQLLTSANFAAQYGATTGDVRTLGTTLRYFVPQQGSLLLYLAGSFDTVQSPSGTDEVLLGGDTGLRGYPIRYQRGTKRTLFTAEERYYTDWYPLRLFRVGAAAYVDVGRAWGGQIPNTSPGWLADFGFGLRVLSARASFGNVLHLDLAFPIGNNDPGVRGRQLVVKTAKTF
jgi:outer membrane protein assembly factor BamA